jgi:hypothetical protein
MTLPLANADASRSAPIGTPVVLLALTVIAVLAFVLPFGAVRTLHARRLGAAHQDLDALVSRIRLDDLRGRFSERASVLIGPGDLPRSADPLWMSGTTAPLVAVDRSAHADPWGNGYVINLGASAAAGATVWLLSAGPDGIIQTPFVDSSATPLGDDLARRLR